MRIINLTDHDPLNIWSNDDIVLSIASSGVVRRAETHADLAPLNHEGVEIPVREITYGPVQDLPAPEMGIAYIVSQLVVKGEPRRADLFYPADLVRDEHGTPIGCRTLARTLDR